MRGRNGLRGDEVDARVVGAGCEFVDLGMGGGFVVERGPGLACGRHVLAGVVADGAGGGWGGEGDVELGAAGEADGEVAAFVVHGGCSLRGWECGGYLVGVLYMWIYIYVRVVTWCCCCIQSGSWSDVTCVLKSGVETTSNIARRGFGQPLAA